MNLDDIDFVLTLFMTIALSKPPLVKPQCMVKRETAPVLAECAGSVLWAVADFGMAPRRKRKR